MHPDKSDAKALIIVVHYRTECAALALLASLERLKRFHEVDVVIVDNASGGDHVERLRFAVSEIDNVELIESPLNLGYFGAARLVLDQQLRRQHALPDWIIVSNADILVEDLEFLDTLLGLDPSSLGMVAPRVIVPRWNFNQNPFLRERPRGLRRLTMRLYSHDYFLAAAWDFLSRAKRAVRSSLVGTRLADPAASEGPQIPIYAPHGSFMIFSRKYFEAGGYLDDQLFLFAEEISVGEICLRLGLPVVYNPALSVVHNERKSLGVGVTRSTFKYQQRSVHYVLSKYLTP